LDEEETFILASWRAGGQPIRSSRFAAQFMLNVGFVEALAMRVIGKRAAARYLHEAAIPTAAVL